MQRILVTCSLLDAKDGINFTNSDVDLSGKWGNSTWDYYATIELEAHTDAEWSCQDRTFPEKWIWPV